MAGLLDFALGFGAGAAGGFVEQKKADLEEQRKANLMRLQAKYNKEARADEAAAKALNRQKIYDLFKTDPQAAERLAFSSGVDISDITSTQTAASPLGRLVQDRNRAQARGDLELVEFFNTAIEREAQGDEMALITARSDIQEEREIASEERQRAAQRRQTIERVGILKRARAGDASAQNEADVLGLDWRIEPTKANLVNLKGPDGTVIGINTSTAAGMEKLNQLLANDYVEAGKASLEAPVLSGELVRVHGGGIDFQTLSDDPRVSRALTENPDVRVDPVMPQTRTDFAGREIISRGGVEYVKMPDGTERPLSEIEGRTGATPSETQAPASIARTPTTEELSPAELPPGDYVRFATGPLQAIQRFGLNLPGLGDFLGMFAAKSEDAVGFAQTRAVKSFEMAQRNFAKAYRYNATRTSNLDIESAEKLFPKFGILSTDIGTYAQAVEMRREILNDIVANREIARVDLPANEVAPAKAREEARTFLSNIKLVLPAIDSYINGYELTEVKIPIGNQKRQLIDLSYDVLTDPEKVPASAFANLSNREKELVKLWFNYNGWQF